MVSSLFDIFYRDFRTCKTNFLNLKRKNSILVSKESFTSNFTFSLLDFLITKYIN